MTCGKCQALISTVGGAMRESTHQERDQRGTLTTGNVAAGSHADYAVPVASAADRKGVTPRRQRNTSFSTRSSESEERTNDRGPVISPLESANCAETACPAGDQPRTYWYAGNFHGHGWVRTNDFSRVKRLPSRRRRGLFAGSLAADLALRSRIYYRGLLGFVAVVVHGINLWTSGAHVCVVPVSSGPERLEEVTGRA